MGFTWGERLASRFVLRLPQALAARLKAEEAAAEEAARLKAEEEARETVEEAA